MNTIIFYKHWRETRKSGLKKYMFTRIKNGCSQGLLIYLALFSCHILFMKRLYPVWFVHGLIETLLILMGCILISWKYNEYKFRNVLNSYKTVK